MKRFDVDHLARIAARLAQLEHADYSPLMEQWEDVITADNRRGILAGLDKDGQPLAPVKYRPTQGATGKPKNRKKDRGFKGYGPLASGLHGNLSSGEYRKLTGPPLAPRGANSRVITNLATRHGRQGGLWFAEGAWLDIVSVDGVPFLEAHLKGEGRLPKRDIAGVRPEGRAKAREQLRRFALRLARRRG